MLKKLLSKIRNMYYEYQYKKAYQQNDDEMEFVWGIKAYDDLTECDASLYTMNDIDIIYHKKEKKYGLNIETMCSFSNKEAEKSYIRSLFVGLTDWMDEMGYSTNKSLELYDVFTNGYNINTKFNNIEDLYANFKMLVNGFCA